MNYRIRFILICLGLLTSWQGGMAESLANLVEQEQQKVETILADIDDLLDRIKAAKKEAVPQVSTKSNLEALTKEVDTIERSIKRKGKLLNAYRNGFVPRSVFKPGQSLGRVSLKDGTSFDSAVFDSVSRLGAKIKHPGGIAYLSNKNMPDEMKVNFTLPPHDEPVLFDLSKLAATRPTELKRGSVSLVASEPVATKKEGDSTSAVGIVEKRRAELAARNEMRARIRERLAILDREASKLEVDLREAEDEIEEVREEYSNRNIRVDKKTIESATVFQRGTVEKCKKRIEDIEDEIVRLKIELRK